MASKSKSKAVKKVEVNDSVDLVRGKDDSELYVFAEETMKHLLKKGFCIIDASKTDAQLADLQNEVGQMQERGCFDRPAEELVDGFLGLEGSVRMATVELEAGSSPSTSVEELDAEIGDVASMLGPFTQQYFGFDLSTRSAGYLLEAGQGTDLPAAVFSAQDCMKWLNIFQWQRFMCIFVLGPSPGSLEIQPFDDYSGGHTLTLRPGVWVILRADLLSHKFRAGGLCYTLSSFFMQINSDAELRRKQPNFPSPPIASSLERWLSNAMRTMKETIESEEELETVATREVQRISNHMYHRGQQIAIRGSAARFGGKVSDVCFLQAVLFSGCDTAEAIPFIRWDNELYYRKEPQDGYIVRDTYTCMHGTFLEGMELFDNKFFGLSVAETRGMDPNQRVMLEICYETCFNAGFKKATLMRTHMGVYTGGPAGELEWTKVPKQTESGALASTSGSPAILSNRLSYTFGMNGPNYLMDMEAASGLLAFQQAVDCCLPQRPQADSAVALGVDTILFPEGLARLCWAGLMSSRGRCLSFDHTADGYIRGEGCGGVFMNPLLHEVDGEFLMDHKLPLQAIASGAYANNSGKTASLTAPSGYMEQELIAGTLKRAEISPLDVDFVDPHAPGSLLGDAVEVTALVKCYRVSGLATEEMLGIGSVKTLFGNTKPASGLLTVLKQMVATSFGHMTSCVHLLRLNPHMLVDDVPVMFATDHTPNRMNSSFSAISSKGMGGCNVHAIIWGQVDYQQVSRPKTVPTRQPISFWPGGGGDLDTDAVPNKNYTIVGSWAGWADPQPMEAEGNGTYGYRITLGEHAMERFQIWLDGDANKVLHPMAVDAPCDSPVHGPDRGPDIEMNYWLINGQPQYVGFENTGAQQALTDAGDGEELSWVQTNLKDVGSPGDQYHIQLLVNGQYRAVTWEKVMETRDDEQVAVRSEVPVGKYFLSSSWNDWQYTEMLSDAESEGLFYLETYLVRRGGTFNIVRNQDERQTIYPQIPYCNIDEPNPALGPDDQGRAFYWYISGDLGDHIRIELKKVYKDGCVSMDVSWKKVSHQIPSPLVSQAASRSQFFLVGTLGRWRKRHKMTFNGKYYAFELSVRLGNLESFQILMDGDWNLMLYPPEEDGAKDSILRGPDELGQGLYWTIGKSEEERSGRFEVQLYTARGSPLKVTWVRR